MTTNNEVLSKILSDRKRYYVLAYIIECNFGYSTENTKTDNDIESEFSQFPEDVKVYINNKLKEEQEKYESLMNIGC